MHREGRVDSSNAEAVDAQPVTVDTQAVVEPGRRVVVVLRRCSNGSIFKTILSLNRLYSIHEFVYPAFLEFIIYYAQPAAT